MKNTRLTEPMKAALREMRRYQPMSPPPRGDRTAYPHTLARGATDGGGSMRSRSWPDLRDLQVGDEVPRSLYVLDYRGGERPRWTVHEVEELGAGVRRLVLVDVDNGSWDLFHDPEHPVAVTVLTCARFTRRTRPYMLGYGEPDAICDMDQQGRRAVPELAEDAA